MTTTEVVLLFVCVCSFGALFLVLKNSIPAHSVDDLQKDLNKMRVDLNTTHETVGVYKANMEVLQKDLETATFKAVAWEQEAKKLQFQSKSSQVKTGQLTEHLVGLLDGFDYDTKQMRFIGSPIDYVVFGEDMITFLEIKSGGSQLSAKQRHLRELVKSGKVEWKTVRLTEKGLKK